MQGYEQLSLYKDLFDARDRDEETWRNNNVNTLQFDTRAVPGSSLSTAPEDDPKRAAALSAPDASFEDELMYIRSRDREALELVFGVPLPVRIYIYIITRLLNNTVIEHTRVHFLPPTC